MTTSQVSSNIQHTTDAEFRLWGSQIRDQLLAAGLTKTADTGQIDWTTATRPAVNVSAGYEIWRFNDALHATAPIFFKIEYGTSSAGATVPHLWLTVGSGSNGAGTITGITMSRRDASRGLAPSAAVNQSYACYSTAAGGFFFAGWNGSATATPFTAFAFGIWRSCDDSGVPNGDGYSVYYLNSAQFTAIMWSVVNNVLTSPSTTFYTFNPGGANVLATAFGADINVFKHFMAVPRMRPILGMLMYNNPEIGKGTTFSLATFGATVHTFMALGDGLYGSPDGNAQHVHAMLWE